MVSIANLMAELEERTIAKKVGIPHDEARMKYFLRSNTAADWREFEEIIGDYYQHHFTSCVSRGGSLLHEEAISKAKEIIEEEYRRRQGDIVTAYNDAHDGTNGGLRAILDIIAERPKAKSVERYIRGVFDRYVAPNSWETKVEIIRQFIDQCGVKLSSSIQADQPERYAQNYKDLIRAYARTLEGTSSVIRRL